MSLVTVRKAFIDWIRNVTSYDANHVIWEDQNMPRPTKPYISCRLTAFNIINQSFLGGPDNSGHATISGDREFTLGLICFGSADPITTLLDLQLSLSELNPYKILQDAGIAFVDTLLGPTDTTVKKSLTEFEERANMDLLMRIPWSRTDTGQGRIETVAIEGTAINISGVTIDVFGVTVQANP